MLISDLNYLETASADVLGGGYFSFKKVEIKVSVKQDADADAKAVAYKGDAKAIASAYNSSTILL